MASRPRRFFVMPDIDQPDPEPGFQHSSDEFIIPAKDEDGNSARLQFRAPAQLTEWAASIVASKKFPFMREGDLMRYCLFLGCCQLAKIEKSVPNLQADIEQRAALVRRRMHAAGILKHIDYLGEELEKLRKMEAWGEITYLLAGEIRKAEKAKEHEPFWGKRWLDELHERFDHLRQQAESKLDFIDLRPSRAYHIEDDTPEE